VYAVTGFITVTNPSTTQPVIASSILAVLGDGQGSDSNDNSSSAAAQTVAVRAECSEPFPLTIAAKGSVQCMFDLEVPSQQASQINAVVMTRSGDRCYTQQGMPYAFASAARAQQPAAANAADGCTVLSIRFLRRDIAASSIVLDQSVADEDGSSTAAGKQNVSVLARRMLCKPAKFGFTANFKAQPGFLNCSESQVRHQV
jgi:hypothetical protein